MGRLADNISDFFFPNRCALCDGFIPWDRLICSECEDKLTEENFCFKCGKSPCQCPQGHIYDGCAALYPYEGGVRDGVLLFKYRRGFNIARLIAPKLANRLIECGFNADVITAVPMESSRRRETGYNQSEYIAKLISGKMGVPVDFSLIKKRGNTPMQHYLSAEERKAAADKSYFAGRHHSDITGKTVLLCDDIITTGSTLNACAAVLKKIGAEKVFCAVLASTKQNYLTGE